jgi:predicted ATPase/DNA-binding CsgD family transcriptional regulator/DNA-binding transcriptional regulator YiaG
VPVNAATPRLTAATIAVTAAAAPDPAAARLRSLRARLGLSQEQLARHLGVSFATVNRWESGRTQLSPRALRAIAGLEAELAAPGSVPRGQLPLAHTSFIGREAELAELTRVLTEARLVSLIGPGGAGKTRLAAEAISRCLPDADVVFLPLESVRLPGSLTPALASRLGVHDQPGVSLAESLQAALAGPPRLLVLDGAESLRDEAASLARDLLAAAPNLRIVVTSRVLLGVPGEVCWTVPPLGCPSVAADAAGIASSDAVRLFVARATDRLPEFQASDVAPHAIAELCRRLDGLPLAIELIASWVGTLSIREILQQRAVLLDSDPAAAGHPGGRRLGDVLQVSYDLLDPPARRMLPMLSCFAGRFGLADAAAVLDVSVPAAAATIRALVDSSWLVVSRGTEQNRFGMLETIRSFAAARLEASGDAAAARDRHVRHFADLAIASEDGLTGPEAADWTQRMEVAEPDLQLALERAVAHDDTDLGLAAAAGLWRWWLLSGRLAQGRAWLARILASAGQRTDEAAGRARCAAAVLATENGDYREAIRDAEQAQQVFAELGLRERTAFAATVLASAHRYLGDNAAARRNFELALELRTALGDRRGVSVAVNNMALLDLDDGNLEGARQQFERSLAIKRELGEQRSIAIGLANLADVLIRSGQWADADEVLAEGAVLAAGIPQIEGTIRCNQGNLAAHREDWTAAAEHFQAAIAASQAAGHPHDAVEAMIGLARVRYRTGLPASGLAQLRAARTLAAGLESPQRIADVDAALAELAREPKADGGSAPRRAATVRALTARQAEVLGLLAAGLSNKQIAERLVLSPATVERHLATIYRNLGLTGRVEATRFAIEHDLAPRKL